METKKVPKFLTKYFFFCREIQMATGEWIHDYLNRNGNGVKRNKSINNGQRLYVATQHQGMHQNLQPHDSKRSIKRSWTISSKDFQHFMS